MKNEKAILYGITGFLLGITITVFTASNAVNKNDAQMMNMMGMKHSSEQAMMNRKTESGRNEHGTMEHSMMDMSMSDMSEVLKGKTGDEFDKLFIGNMIPHHQGAIDMAELALENAGHQEIKDLAEDIISAQKSEIEMMKGWQNEWGY